ncbi:replication factor C small subunit [Nanoarchaeota archaeon]
MGELWTERYRPKEFSEIFGQEDIVDKAQAFVQQKNMPHLMFAGPAGTGKSSLSIIIVKKLYGKEWRSNYLELNASDERGIDVVRQKIKGFARTRTLDGTFKIIFLDEADALTKDAQQALRRTMEMFTQTCRFIMSCNYSSKIIDPIQSRCAVFRFRQLDKAAIMSILNHIIKTENLEMNEEAKELLYEVSGGDCRRLINMLQASAITDKNITPEMIVKISRTSRPQDIKVVIDAALNGSFLKARDLLLDLMLEKSLPGMDIIKGIMREIPQLNIDERLKVKLIEKCGETEFHLVEGSDEFIQLEALLATFVLAGMRK